MTDASPQRSRAERYAREFAVCAAKKRMLRQTPELNHYLESFPEDVLVALEGFVDRVTVGGTHDPLALGHLLLLQGLLERIRYRSDRSFEAAIQLIETVQHNVADLAVTGRIAAEALSMLIVVFHQAGIAISDELRAAVTQCCDDASSDAAANDPAAMIEEIAQQCAGDSYLFSSMFAETGHAMPVEVRTLTATLQARSAVAAAREAAVLLLLDPEPAVRHAAAAELQAGASRLSPVSLRRLIAMRNWCPPAERQLVDAIVRAARAEGIECAPWETGGAEAILASCIDGSGAQGFLIVSPAGRRKRLSSILLKNGVRDAWAAPPEPRRQVQSTLSQAAIETSMIPVGRDYLDRIVQHHLQVALSTGAPPPAGLLQVAETIGGAQWQPELADWREILAGMIADLPPAMLEPDAIGAVLCTSADWAQFGLIAQSWFEDDQEMARLVGRPRGHQRAKMAQYVLEEVLAPRREKWAEHFVWTALWLRQLPDDGTVPWREFAILAQALASGRDLSDISLMHDIAASTVMVLAAA